MIQRNHQELFLQIYVDGVSTNGAGHSHPHQNNIGNAAPNSVTDLRTFAPIATAHPYSARKFTCHVMHRARALSTKMNNDRADGHCYSFAWI